MPRFVCLAQPRKTEELSLVKDDKCFVRKLYFGETA